MSRFFWLTGILAAALLLLAAPVSAQQINLATPYQFTTQTDPVSLLGAYYNAISRAEYDRAYSYWESAPDNQTAAQFAAGFADTVAARAVVYLPIFTGVGAGNAYASLPTLVIAQHSDGVLVYYAGCFTLHKTNVPVGNATEPDPNWHLQKGVLHQQDVPDLSVLDSACEQTDTLTSMTNTPLGQLDPVQLVTSYFSLWALGNGQQATYWQSQNGDLFSELYGQSMGGASNYRLYVNPEIYSSGAAGSIYTSIPALTAVTASDGVRRYIGGCYTARLSDVPVGNATQPDPNWYFQNVTLNLTLDQATAVNTLAEGCPSF